MRLLQVHRSSWRPRAPFLAPHVQGTGLGQRPWRQGLSGANGLWPHPAQQAMPVPATPIPGQAGIDGREEPASTEVCQGASCQTRVSMNTPPPRLTARVSCMSVSVDDYITVEHFMGKDGSNMNPPTLCNISLAVSEQISTSAYIKRLHLARIPVHCPKIKVKLKCLLIQYQ